MWLLVITLAAVIVTAIWYVNDKARKYYHIGILNLMLWGTAIMVFVDHMMGYLDERGEFIETTPEAMLLSIVLIITVLIVWELVLLIKDPKGLLKHYIK
jgi:peptidoglycan biosynthesis protein MviN/MurJ (putative lipid II flippase)